MSMSFFTTLDISLSLQELGNIMLPVVGTLLGLIYAALIYWLEGGFSKLEHTRGMLEESLASDGKVLLDLLVGATAISLFAVIDSRTMASIGFWIFAVFYFKDLLISVGEQGYIKAVFGPGRIPQNANGCVVLIAKLHNSGWQGLLRIIFFSSPTIILPIFVNWGNNPVWKLTDNSIKIYIVSVTLFALVQVRSLLTLAFTIRKQINQQTRSSNIEAASTLNDENIEEWDKKRISLESSHLQELLEGLEIYTEFALQELINKPDWTSRDITSSPVLRWQSNPTKKGHFHMNLWIPYFRDASTTRDYIFTWTQKIFFTLAESTTEVSSFAISFYRKDEYGESHLAQFRDTKSNILSEKDKGISEIGRAHV